MATELTTTSERRPVPGGAPGGGEHKLAGVRVPGRSWRGSYGP